MSAYTTKVVTRERAEQMLRDILIKQLNFSHYTDRALADKLNEFAYSEEHTDILGVLYNYQIN